MSVFGSWECPNCGTTWVGSIGWDFTILDDEDRLNNLLQSMCGCEPVENPEYPEGSASVMKVEISEKRKELLGENDEKETKNA